jgi:hypothetical protein
MVLAAAGATLTFTASRASAAGTHKTSLARPSTFAGEQFRGNVETMLSGLRGVVVQMRTNPAIAKSLSSTGTNLVPLVAAAKEQVAGLDWVQLAQLQASLERDPNWQQAPRVLSAALSAFDAPAATPQGGAKNTIGSPGGPLAAISGSGTFTDDCLSAGDPYAETIAVLAANEVQSALNAAALAAPGVIALVPAIDSPTGIRIGLMIAWGVADGIYLALAQTLAVSVDCAQTAFSNTQESTLSVDPSGSGTDNIVPTSTQFSIDRLIAKAGDTQTKINAVQTTVNTVDGQADTIGTDVTVLNNILNDITDRVDDVQTGLQKLQTRVAILQNTEVTILKKADTLIANLSTFQTLQLRMEIEDNLDRNDESPIGLFQLPAAYGGYLEVVMSIVTDTLAKEAAVGNPSPKAMTYLTQANAAFAAGTYKTAYALYRKAYGYGR